MSKKPSPGGPSSAVFATQHPVMTILSDHPILRDGSDERAGSVPEGDAFELHTRLGAVYDIIRHQNTRAPMAIGIFGDWGTGKSSAMRWLADQLNIWSGQGDTCKPHFRCRCVWFEPWKYQTRDDVWRGLIAEVILHSINPKTASVATVVSAAKKFGAFLGRSFIHAVSSIELGGSADTGKVLPNVGVEGKINLDALTKIAEDYKQTVRPEKAYLNEFESMLKSWVADSLGGDERMVVFIDDLDRCLPGVTLEVLEALKLYLNIPQLVFVIGLDRDVVKAVIRKQYREAGLAELKADSYLDKIFQVEVEVPPSEEQMDGYFAAQLKELDAATNSYWTSQLRGGGAGWADIIEGTIKAIALHNPREIKRLLNSTLMGGAAAARRATDEADSAKLFGQGCQAYLIARIMRDMDGNPAATLRLKDTWTFLELWSKFTRDYALYRPDKAAASDAKAPGDRGPEKEDPERKKREDEVRRLMPRTLDVKNQPYPLWDKSILWDLLAIECSARVGLSVASRAVEAKPVVPASPPIAASATAPAPAGGPVATDAVSDAVVRLPLIVRSRLAKQLRKDEKDLTSRDLASVKVLDLSGSDIDDHGLRELAREDTGLRAISSLDLSFTRVTDVGLKDLAREGTGLKTLTSLNLWSTDTTVAAYESLAAKGGGLHRLRELHVSSRADCDAVAQVLARPNNALEALTQLDFVNTKLTDAGLKALSHPDTGVKALTKLTLWNTLVTDAGLKELAREGTGLKALTSLDLGGTRMTDAGLKELVREGTGLKALTSLDLSGTRVTKAGIAALKGRFPDIEILR